MGRGIDRGVKSGMEHLGRRMYCTKAMLYDLRWILVAEASAGKEMQVRGRK